MPFLCAENKQTNKNICYFAAFFIHSVGVGFCSARFSACGHLSFYATFFSHSVGADIIRTLLLAISMFFVVAIVLFYSVGVWLCSAQWFNACERLLFMLHFCSHRPIFAYNFYCDNFGAQKPPSLRESGRVSGGRSKNPVLQLSWNQLNIFFSQILLTLWLFVIPRHLQVFFCATKEPKPPGVRYLPDPEPLGARPKTPCKRMFSLLHNLSQANAARESYILIVMRLAFTAAMHTPLLHIYLRFGFRLNLKMLNNL